MDGAELCSNPQNGYINKATISDEEQLFSRVHTVRRNYYINYLITKVKDKDTNRADYIYYVDRLTEIVCEASTDFLNYEPCSYISHNNNKLEGVSCHSKVHIVSLIRSGEIIDRGLACCFNNLRTSRILMEYNRDGYYQGELLMSYCVDQLNSRIIKDTITLLVSSRRVDPKNIVVLCLFINEEAIEVILDGDTPVRIVTMSVEESPPVNMGQRYYGTQ